MQGVALRAALGVAVIAALVAAQGARFGDRLAPRVPNAYQPRSALHDKQYADYEDAYEDEEDEEEPEEELHREPEPPPQPPPRRPVRTEAHRLEMSTEFFVVPERSTPAPISSPTHPPIFINNSSGITHVVTATPITGTLRNEPWALPVLALSCTCMIIIGAFEAFVIWGARRTAPSRRHLMLGQTLLLGLFISAASAGLISVAPSPFSCGAIRFGTGVAYALVFASLLVKCVFLLSLNGGVYLPAAYQCLLLFFAVMIQVAIGAQWLGGAPPHVVNGRCASQLSDMLLSLSYAAFLIAVVCGVALRSRGIRDNYCEATHIGCAAGGSAAVWICWIATALASAEKTRDACVAAGLLGTCVVVFAFMFAPKGRRLAAMGREGRWDTERDEGLSSLGAGGSGYSPSFFHFKPVKYGMVTATAAMPAPPPPPPLERKEPPAQPADLYGALFAGLPHAHARSLCPPPHYLPHPLMHYHYPPYQYLLPPGVVVRGDEGLYTSVEPTYNSTNPNVYFQRSEPLHVGMMY